MPFPSPKKKEINEMAIAAMQALLGDEHSRTTLSITAKNNAITFNSQLSKSAYDIAEALFAEGEARS